MNDDTTPWVAPGARDRPSGDPGPGAAVPPTGEPSAAPYPPPPWEAARASGPTGGGWTPPPRPGLVPLRPLSLGDVLGAAFRVVRRNPRPTFGFALLVSLVIGALTGVVVIGLLWSMLERASMATEADRDAILAGGALTIVLASIATGIVTVALIALPQGIISLEVARGALAERHTLRSLWRSARGRIWVLVGWTLLVTAIVATGIAIAVGIVALVALAGGVAGIVVAILLGLLLAAGLVVLSVWLGTKIAFVPAALMIERRRLRAAIARSWRLTRGRFWRVFGTTLLVNVVIYVAAQVITAPISVIGGMAGVLVNPNQSVEVVNTTTLVLLVVNLAVTTVFQAITLVAQGAVPALLYLDARMRDEGLDLELQRFVEDRAAGRPAVDPFPTGEPAP